MAMTETVQGRSSSPAAAAHPDLASVLDDLRAEIDGLLDRIPDNKLEARRTITRELSLDPTPEELQTIVRIAHEPTDSSDVVDLSRQALALRVLVEREMQEVLDPRALDAAKLTRIAGRLPRLIEVRNLLEGRVAACVETLAQADRKYLRRVVGILIPPRESLVAAAVLTPRLALFAKGVADGDLGSLRPDLTDEEIELIETSARHEDATERPARVCLEALALRTILADDLAAWQALRDAPVSGYEAEEKQGKIVRRLEQGVTAHTVVSARLQVQQDTALVADLRGFVDKLRAARQDLFSVYRHALATLREGASEIEADDPMAGMPTSEEKIEQLFRASASADAEAEARVGKSVTEEELYLGALKRMHGEGSEPELAAELTLADPRIERRRMRILILFAVLLFVSSAGLFVAMLTSRPATHDLAAAELPARLVVTKTIAAAPLLYAQVSRWVWEELGEDERAARVSDLGEEASSRGFDVVFLTDENSVELARWSRADGAQLIRLDP